MRCYQHTLLVATLFCNDHRNKDGGSTPSIRLDDGRKVFCKAMPALAASQPPPQPTARAAMAWQHGHQLLARRYDFISCVVRGSLLRAAVCRAAMPVASSPSGTRDMARGGGSPAHS